MTLTDPTLPPLTRNERLLLELIFRHRRLARVDLTALTGLTGASVTRTIAGLNKLGLFEQSTVRTRRQGQPKKLLSLRANRFFAAGISFNFTHMTVSLVDLAGHLVSSTSRSFHANDINDFVGTAWKLVGQLLRDHGAEEERIVGMGVSVAGNFGANRLLFKGHPFLAHFAYQETVTKLADSVPVPVYVENDGTTAAIGEYYFGVQEPHDPLFLIHIGHGIGGGAVISGRPYYGAGGNACLLGSLYPYDAPRPSGQDLLAALRERGKPAKDYAALEGWQTDGSGALSEWIERAGDQLRLGIKVISGMFNPQLIVVGGMLPPAINVALVKRLTPEAIESPSRGLQAASVLPSHLGPLGDSVGAACIPLFATFFIGGELLSPWQAI